MSRSTLSLRLVAHLLTATMMKMKTMTLIGSVECDRDQKLKGVDRRVNFPDPTRFRAFFPSSTNRTAKQFPRLGTKASISFDDHGHTQDKKKSISYLRLSVHGPARWLACHTEHNRHCARSHPLAGVLLLFNRWVAVGGQRPPRETKEHQG